MFGFEVGDRVLINSSRMVKDGPSGYINGYYYPGYHYEPCQYTGVVKDTYTDEIWGTPTLRIFNENLNKEGLYRPDCGTIHHA